MKRRAVRRLFWLAAFNALGLLSAQYGRATGPTDGYEFLGDLESYERTERGAVFLCAPGVGLEIGFVTPAVFRVTVDRPDHEEALLQEALVAQEPQPVDVEVVEEQTRVVLRSGPLEVSVAREGCRITVRDKDGFVLSADDPGMGIGWDGDEVRNWKTIAEDERFFGLGEKTGDVDKRGREWVMWNSDIPGYGNETDPLYASVPFFIGVRGGRTYGIYFNNSHRTTFNLGAGNHRYYSFAAEGGALDYFFMYGPEVPAVVEAYTALTGRPPMPPRWALGYQQSRWSYTPAAEVLRVARTFREKEIPADVLYLDIHHMDGYRVFTWDRARFPDPEAMLAELGALGFQAVIINDPGVKVDSTGYAIADQGLENGHFVVYPDGEVYVGSVWPGRSYFPDFSRPETRDWWGDHVANLVDQGIDGIWNDMNEPAVWGKAFPLEVLMEDGGRTSSMKRMHNLYGSLMARATFEGLVENRPDDRPFVLTRAGFAGVQRHAWMWTGDNVASWEHLALGIRMLIGMGLSGLPFVGTDVGGFIGAPSAELYARWLQVGAFAPLFRSHTVHGTPPQDPWSYGEIAEAANRDAIRLRYRLLPYLYTLAREAHDTGHPVLRPLFWHYPEDPQAWDRRWQHQFLVGEDLLVAPVTRAGAVNAEVYLPPGEWLDLRTDAVHSGGRTVVVPAPLFEPPEEPAPVERIPMFLKAGGILPFQEPVQHTAQASERLVVEVFPAGGGETLLYQDDGRSFAYEDGAYRWTRFSVVRSADGFTFVREVLEDDYEPATRLMTIRFHAVDAPSSVTLNGEPLESREEVRERGFLYEAETRILSVRLPMEGLRQDIVIR